MKARHAERLALVAALAVATVAVEVWPDADAWLSARFFVAGRFVGDEWAAVRWVYRGVPWLGALGFAVALVFSLSVWRQPRALAARGAPPTPLARWRWRRATAVVTLVLMGLGGLVHMGLKDGWGRPRPDQVQVFGGAQPFTPALQPSTRCDRNCSFVSGHAGAGFALLALGLFGSRRTRWRWWAIGAVCGGLIGAVRVAQGRHFASDIVFCLLVMWAAAVLHRELWLRWAVWRRRRSPIHDGHVTELS
ncbi:phosphatase PAP2 family protein [Ideonella sp. DXS22W]|uniref:Phosphatase PAP2 family protein n=1 Tax=Pseudaquabacterium inlustre TaxID=2984192 RepID=A0ABU9CEU4_9BURK